MIPSFRTTSTVPRPFASSISAVRSFPMISSAVWRFLPLRPAPYSIRSKIRRDMLDRYQGVRSDTRRVSAEKGLKFLKKPFTITSLNAVVRDVLNDGDA